MARVGDAGAGCPSLKDTAWTDCPRRRVAPLSRTGHRLVLLASLLRVCAVSHI